MFTLATPHSTPVATPDALVADFYREVEQVWRAGSPGTNEPLPGSGGGNLSHVSVVSITGGLRDVQMWSGLGRPRGVADDALLSTVVSDRCSLFLYRYACTIITYVFI